MTEKLLAKEFEEASENWKLPEKHGDADEIQLFTIETDDPEALNKFLELFNARLMRYDNGEFQQEGLDFLIYTKTNGPYVYQMVLANETVGQNCRPFDPNEEKEE